MNQTIVRAAVLPLTAAFALTLAACGGKPSANGPAALPISLGPLETALDIVARPEYLQRGAEDARYDWISKFETETGCTVNVTPATDSQEIYGQMAEGGHDVVIAPSDMSLQLIRAGLVQPINTALVPSYNAIDIRLRRALWHYVRDVHYGVPFQWAPNLLLYDTSIFETPPASWSVVFEPQDLPDGKPNAGRIEAYDAPIALADASLYLFFNRRELGILNPYQLEEPQYAAVLELMRGQRSLLHAYWHDPQELVRAFAAGEVVASGAWPRQLHELEAMGRPVAGTIPQEGATGRADTTMIATQAKHPNCAYRWLEWSIGTKTQGDVAAWAGTVPAVTAACENNALLGPGGCKANGAEDFDRIWFWRTPEKECDTAFGRCVPYERWVSDFDAIRQAAD